MINFPQGGNMRMKRFYKLGARAFSLLDRGMKPSAKNLEITKEEFRELSKITKFVLDSHSKNEKTSSG
jgi:hypothetical protein